MTTIPLSIKFIEIGESVIELLFTGEPARYTLKGEVDVVTSLPLLGEVALPFEKSSEIPFAR
jgi:hypothetical protein